MTAEAVRIAAWIIGGLSLAAIVTILGGFAWRNRRAMTMRDREAFEELKRDGYPVVWRGDNDDDR